MKNRSAWFAIAAVAVLLIAAPDAFAGTSGNANVGFYDDILLRFKSAATGWQSVITNAASWLFWTLAVISMVWTFGMMALRKAGHNGRYHSMRDIRAADDDIAPAEKPMNWPEPIR